MSTPSIKRLSVGLRYMPLKSPFVTAKGRTETARALVIELSLSDGTVAYGSCTPAQYVTGESLEDAEASIRRMGAIVPGYAPTDYEALFQKLEADFPRAHAARA